MGMRGEGAGSMSVRLVIRSAEGQPLSEEVSYDFDQARIVIGRGAGADVRIPHLTVSELHATLRLQDDAYSLIDNDSTNGTWVNGTRLATGRTKRLHDGDRIEVGAYALTFRSGVVLTQPTTMERTAELARRLFRRSEAGSRVGAPRLVVLSGEGAGRSLDIPAPIARVRIGRGDTCQLVLPDPDVSREHAEVVHDLDGVLMHNLESKNGLSINGQTVSHRRLRDGDELLFGTTRLLFEEPAEEPIDALGSEADRSLSKPPKVMEAPQATAAALAAVQAGADAAPAPSTPARIKKRASFDADVIIYALAAIVIAVSIAGLLALMRGD
jgi:pSer/pThr/pTyr-binding forkhead associated (FHA) protein